MCLCFHFVYRSCSFPSLGKIKICHPSCFPFPVLSSSFLCSSGVTVTLFRLLWSEGKEGEEKREKGCNCGGEKDCVRERETEKREERKGRRDQWEEGGITWLTGCLKAKNKCWSFSHSWCRYLSLSLSLAHTHAHTCTQYWKYSIFWKEPGLWFHSMLTCLANRTPTGRKTHEAEPETVARVFVFIHLCVWLNVIM